LALSLSPPGLSTNKDIILTKSPVVSVVYKEILASVAFLKTIHTIIVEYIVVHVSQKIKAYFEKTDRLKKAREDPKNHPNH
jgi:hypothetical protein